MFFQLVYKQPLRWLPVLTQLVFLFSITFTDWSVNSVQILESLKESIWQSGWGLWGWPGHYEVKVILWFRLEIHIVWISFKYVLFRFSTESTQIRIEWASRFQKTRTKTTQPLECFFELPNQGQILLMIQAYFHNNFSIFSFEVLFRNR